jgi:hypothetical protein
MIENLTKTNEDGQISLIACSEIAKDFTISLFKKVDMRTVGSCIRILGNLIVYDDSLAKEFI